MWEERGNASCTVSPLLDKLVVETSVPYRKGRASRNPKVPVHAVILLNTSLVKDVVQVNCPKVNPNGQSNSLYFTQQAYLYPGVNRKRALSRFTVYALPFSLYCFRALPVSPNGRFSALCESIEGCELLW